MGNGKSEDFDFNSTEMPGNPFKIIKQWCIIANFQILKSDTFDYCIETWMILIQKKGQARLEIPLHFFPTSQK